MIKLYYHGGSANHGCEAIVRSTVKIIGEEMQLFSTNVEDDNKYRVNEIIQIKEDKINEMSNLNKFISNLYYRLTKKTDYSTKIMRKTLIENISKNDICLSIGGDNYCYSGQEILSNINNAIRKKGAKTVLWGCSVDGDMINEEVKKDLEDYSLIITRESLSYKFLKSVNKNTVLLPDPAFQLDKKDMPLPNGFIENNTIGINVSPLIIGCENKEGITLSNYRRLIEWIIEETDCNVALIPHVVSEYSDDRTPLSKLYNEYKDTNRVVIIEDKNCMELKSYISKCRFFIGSRTHATIAAYSTEVPTLVVGYSIKAKGIAYDLFDSYENYVIPVQDLKEKNDLANAFKWIYENEDMIKNRLKEIIPTYKEKALLMYEEIKKIKVD